MRETAEADLDFAKDADGRGRFTVAGTDRSVAMEEIVRASFDPARLPEGMAPGLDDDVIFERDNVTSPNGCHIAEVEVDPETGGVRIADYDIFDTFGRLINPLTADGQSMGGQHKGIGTHLP